jgi:hypothetical protein
MVYGSTPWKEHSWEHVKTICEQSGLNDIYTNHYLRATSITVLNAAKELHALDSVCRDTS